MTEILLFSIYLAILIPLAWLGKVRTEKKSPADFYLAGGNLGFLVLLCTLFATQYSGNTFLAFPGNAYRVGYANIMSVTFMMAIIAGYLLYAPQLRKIAREKGFITPGDWIQHRYQNLPLTLLSSFLMGFALLNFFLAQLMAMGHAISGLTGGAVPYAAGVLFLALIIVIYESVGGMRAVAWTDTIQGGLMLLAVFLLGFFFLREGDLLRELPEKILAIEPQKIAPPNWATCMTWGSTILLVGIGGAMYPQGIQRIYASRSARTLKRSLSVMVFLPLVTVFFAFMVGIMAISQFPGLETIQSDEVMVLMLNYFSEQGLFLKLAQSIFLVGALAAIMSTADSVLLSLSSIIVQDFYAKTSRKKIKDARLLNLGKGVSWFLTGVLVLIALKPEFTLWRLLEIKFQLLIQVAPAFILGFYRPNLKGNVALVGMAVGTAITLIGLMSGQLKWFGLHPGTIGFALNLFICWSLSRQP